MRKLSIAVLIVGIAVAVALTGCGGGGGGDLNPPPVTGNTIVTGKVIDDRVPSHNVQGVVVSLGSLVETTKDDGTFRFELGSSAAVSSLFVDVTQAVFKVSTTAVNAKYPEVAVYYQTKVVGQGYPQENGSPASIPLPFEVLMASGVTKDLGQIIVQYYDPNDPGGSFPPDPW